ncbi:MAG: TolC family protein [Acidobacteria bacterium]|nr:TolC family protein [Acidobacteriota bacterium]
MRRVNVVVLLMVVLALPSRGSGEPAGGNCLDGMRASREPCRESTYGAYGDARLAGLIEEAIENNPSVREALAWYQADLQRIPQAAALPDPVLTVTQHARSPETRAGPQTTLLSVTQSFPGFGKRRLRQESTSRAAAVRVAELEARRAEMVRRLKLSYYELGYVDRAPQINREETELLAHYETRARATCRDSAGRVTSSDCRRRLPGR